MNALVRTSLATVVVAIFALTGGCNPAPGPDPGNQNAANDNTNGNTNGNDNQDANDNGSPNDNDNTADGNGNDNGSPAEPVWREAFDAEALGFLSSAWGPTPDNIVAVGGQPDEGRLVRYDGESWSDEVIPDVPLLVWTFGFGADDLYAVGEGGGAIHFDGTTWTALDTGTDIDLFGIWGAASDDMWIVGGNANDGPMIILHFDGTTFTESALPAIDPPSTALFKVWGTSADNVFAVGEAGVILHYDGTGWSQQTSPADDDLVSLWGTGPDNIVAVGGRANAIVLTYDGSNWTAEDAFGLPALNGVFVTEEDEAVIGGVLGTVARFDLAAGTYTLETSPTTLPIHAIFGDGQGRFYALGGRTFVNPFDGVALVRTVE